MELVPWLIFAAIALFFDVGMGWLKRKAREAEARQREMLRGQVERGELYVETDEEGYETYKPYEEVYVERSFETPPVEEVRTIPTYDEEERVPVPLETAELKSLLRSREQELVRERERERTRDQTRRRERREEQRGEERRRGIKADVTPVAPYARRYGLTLNPTTARQAVIWMEVLGTPKGLR